jgi:glyoxylase-like metal-dependent hydrolase (beta-lactamase superfamily II)
MSIYIRQLQLGPMQNFVYLIGPADSVETAVIDPAWDIPTVLRMVEEDGRRITHALVTHRHFDHTYGLEPLLEKVSVPIVIHQAEIPHLTGDLPRSAFQPIAGDEVIEIGKLPIRCLSTPGHTPGCVCFHCDVGTGSVFTGDTLFVNACGRCDFEGGDPRQMYNSLNGVLGALPAQTAVYPGHDYGDVPVSSLGREREKNPYLQMPNAEAFTAFRMRPRG